MAVKVKGWDLHGVRRRRRAALAHIRSRSPLGARAHITVGAAALTRHVIFE